MPSRIDNSAHPINPCYIQASYFLTGENRVYDRSMARWTRVRPFENFFRYVYSSETPLSGTNNYS